MTLRSLISWDHPEILLCRGHWIGGEVHRHREWLETARRRVLSEWESGASRDDIAERLMQQLYTEEVREFGWVLDLGILSPELYRVEAEALVDAALQSQVTRRKSGRRSA